MRSTRLPGKSMRMIAGAPLVEHVLNRVRQARGVDLVVLATSDVPADDVLASHVAQLGFQVCRGSEADVLGRILKAAHMHGATMHVQCWGDCPFVDPDEVDAVIAGLRQGTADLVSNCVGSDRRTPYGLDVIAFRLPALEEAERRTRDKPYHREHGTTYIYQTAHAFQVERVDVPDDIAFPDLDLTINTEEDFQFVERVYTGLLALKRDFRIRDVLAFLRQHPDILSVKNRKALEMRC